MMFNWPAIAEFWLMGVGAGGGAIAVAREPAGCSGRGFASVADA
jgi:hypothetical protein